MAMLVMRSLNHQHSSVVQQSSYTKNDRKLPAGAIRQTSQGGIQLVMDVSGIHNVQVTILNHNTICISGTNDADPANDNVYCRSIVLDTNHLPPSTRYVTNVVVDEQAGILTWNLTPRGSNTNRSIKKTESDDVPSCCTSDDDSYFDSSSEEEIMIK